MQGSSICRRRFSSIPNSRVLGAGSGWLTPSRDCQEFCARGRFRHWLTNLSPKTTANWVLASNHSRGGRFHSSAAWFRTRYSSFMAASSLGKWPLVRTARRSFEFSASMALVV